jgi:IclR family mhp operon transcriptional activator
MACHLVAKGTVMTELLQTRSLHRGLDILEALSAGPASLHELHLRTGHPKSTLRRLLATMIDRRYIRRGLSDGIYRSNIPVPSASHGELTLKFGRLVEISSPHMLALTQRVKWPSDLHVYHEGRMLILESTHGLSPFDTARSAGADTQLNMFVAASGLAYLSALNRDEIKKILELTQDDEVLSPARFGVTPALLRTYIEEVHKRGYSVRRASQSKPDNRNAIALPVFDKGRPAAALTIAWRREHMSAEQFASLHMPAFIETARVISAELGSPSLIIKYQVS